MPPHVILITNYPPDAQESMQRFGALLESGLRARGLSVSRLAPQALVGPRRARRQGVGKWLGYIDKFVFFPLTLRAAVGRQIRRHGNVVVHICDHSNAIYTKYLRDVPHLVTCNDLLAIRSARGEFPENPVRWSGRRLQRLILEGLNRAPMVACISDATRSDVLRLCRLPATAIRRVYMGQNFIYARVARELVLRQVDRLLAAYAPSRRVRLAARPFILHVGGNQWYKNRLGVLRIYESLKARRGTTTPALFMAGAAFTESMREFVSAHGIADDVVELPGVTNDELAALYSGAELLLFPSLAEGFGWPVIEALACACRVVTSNRPPLTETGGDAAVYIDPVRIAEAAAAVSAILDESITDRERRVERGLRHQRAFSTDAMIGAYLDLYETVINPPASTAGVAV